MNYETQEELNYEVRELQKAFQKQNGTYFAKSENGKFQTGDKVIVHSRRGDIIGTITDFDINIMTWKEQAEIDYVEDGKTMTMLCVPLSKIEKIKEN